MLGLLLSLLKGFGKVRGLVGTVKSAAKYATVVTKTIDSFEEHYEKEFGKPFNLSNDVKVSKEIK